jgi:hypothetical protein
MKQHVKTIIYPYAPGFVQMLLGAVFCALMMISTAQTAWTNKRGVIINHILPLNHHVANAFCAFLAVMAGIGTLFMLRGMYVAMFAPHRIILWPTSITAPKSTLSRGATCIPLADIRKVRLVEHKTRLELHIFHAGGGLAIQEVGLPDRRAFETLAQALAQRLATDAN